MAARKPLFMSAEGYSEEMATSDSATFGGLTLGGNIAMGGNRITGLVTDPIANDEATSKAYVDAVAQGLQIKDPVQVVAVANVAALSGVGGVIDGRTILADDRVLLTSQTAVAFSGTGDSIDAPITGTGDSLTFALGTVTLVDSAAAFTANDVGKRITISGATNPGNNGTFEIATRVDGNTITFANAAGVTETSAFSYVSNDVSLIDAGGTFPALAAGMKIIISGATNPANDGSYYIHKRISGTQVIYTNALAVAETSSFTYTGEAGITNGIWVAKSGAWVRPVDFAAGAHASHAFVFVEVGSVYADTGWVCTTDLPLDIIDDNRNDWVQFSSAGVILAGGGLVKVGQTISVRKGDGIEITSNSAATNVALSVTTPGLALVGTSPNKTLEALTNSTTGAIQKGASGIELMLNGTTLGITGSGASVLGVPNLFEIGGTATVQTAGFGMVTAANLNTLTAGASSNADALHVHTIGAATEAPKIENSLPVGEAIAAADPVYQTNTNNRIGKGDTVDPKAFIIGVARTGQATIGNTAEIVSIGACAGILGGLATAGDRYYLQTGGGIGTALPLSGKRIVRVGYALNGTDLWVEIADFGKKA